MMAISIGESKEVGKHTYEELRIVYVLLSL